MNNDAENFVCVYDRDLCIPCNMSAKIFAHLLKLDCSGTSLIIQGLRLCTLNAVEPGSIPGQGTRSHMLQLTPSTAQKNEFFFFKRKKI